MRLRPGQLKALGSSAAECLDTDAAAENNGRLRRVESAAPANATFADGTPMPPGTIMVVYNDGEAVYYLDSSRRTISAEGNIKLNENNDYRKGTPPTPEGLIRGVDDRGHLVTEGLATDQRTANVRENVVAENRDINQARRDPEAERAITNKRDWERKVGVYMKAHPGATFRTCHEPIYKGNSMRPDKIIHRVYMDGQEVTELSWGISNPV